jgi:O-antigen/teichoic acid export membrane protein
VKHNLLVKLLSSAILVQALQSAASLGIGLLFIRRTTDTEYGFYVLISSGILLLTALQAAYIQPSLVYGITDQHSTPTSRGRFLGGLFREQCIALLWSTVLLLCIVVALSAFKLLERRLAFLIFAAVCAAMAALYREFFRTALLAYRRPDAVLKGDMVYIAILLVGAYLATSTLTAATFAAITIVIAALAGSSVQKISLRRLEHWGKDVDHGVMRRIFPIGAWACFGSGTHWLFAQGYSYLAAGMLSVPAVAAIAATRTVIMPVNLLSTGISVFLFPTVTTWLMKMPPSAVFRRLILISAALTGVCGIYLLTVWIFQNWIFATVMKKSFANQGMLLGLWILISITMLLRDQMAHILVARARFRLLSWLTLGCAAIALLISYLTMRRFGAYGALLGLLAGELVNVTGFVLLSLRETRLPHVSPPDSELVPERGVVN